MMAAYAAGALMLSDLLFGIAATETFEDTEIRGLSLDSRTIVPGDCFVALKGESFHGAQFAPAAISAGAAAVLVEDDEQAIATTRPVICIPGLRKVCGRIVSRFFSDPSLSLDVIAVTGTNGKTTVAHLCAQALKQIRGSAGYAGTLGLGPIENLQVTENTTPDPITLQSFFSALIEQQCKSVAIEVSSHAIVQSRVGGTSIDVAVFTNIGHDHLDYHQDRSAYVRAKKSLFDSPGLQHAVINVDDAVGRELLQDLQARLQCWSYSLERTAIAPTSAKHIQLIKVTRSRKIEKLLLATPDGDVDIKTALIGDFNSQNLMAALAALMALGIDAKSAAAVLSQSPGVAGRMQRVEFMADDEPAIIIDYAHTPEGLRCILATLRGVTTGRLICVFGCGGDRDSSKRGPMGRAVEQGADWAIITSDNPRREKNQDIAADILQGVRNPQAVDLIHDREDAIRAAISAAKFGDTVLIAGKGHEIFQDVAGVRHAFSDIEVASRALRERQT